MNNKSRASSKASIGSKRSDYPPLNQIDENIYSDEEKDFLNSNYEEDQEQNSQVTDELAENVISYTNYYDLIRDKKKELRELKNKANPHKEFILNFLNTQHVPAIDVSDGKLIKNVSKKIQPLKEDIIKQSILNKTNDEALANQIIDEIKQIRSQSDKKNINLKRTYAKN
ncbi:hypothetical protein Hokovirus_2_71 [Hokovirus HKV1]|uniref:Uncharacterized protein n=1 Tax=Hokovirus HKV1 TaxID=1977638 RepID=A0A1V0SFX3_9VIRU|nr:hypothetical protein Hokovirus_2_71 [Hokovirus HKV1]